MPAKICLIGKRFGRLIVISDAPNVAFNSQERTASLCRCDCGKTLTVLNNSLRTGNTASCGCLIDELRRTVNKTHGATIGRKATRAYRIWKSMITRATNLNRSNAYRYAGRGIGVCDRWRKFENFLADMGQPAEGMTIGRIQNDGNYEPGNCRWETRSQQMRNKSNNTVLTVDGVTATLVELAELFHIKPSTVSSRIHRLGWSPEMALKTPARRLLKTI